MELRPPRLRRIVLVLPTGRYSTWSPVRESMDTIAHIADTGTAPPDVAPAELDEQTRARLLRAAVCVFDRKGYAAASVREIVEIAGVTKPALYYHFGSKEGVLTARARGGRPRVHRARWSAASAGRARRATGCSRICADLHGLFREHVPVVRVAHSVFFGPVEGAPQFDFTHLRPRDGTRGAADRRGRPGGRRDHRSARRLPTSRSSSSASSASSPPGTCTAASSPLDLDSMKRVLGLIFDGALGAQRQQGEPRS